MGGSGKSCSQKDKFEAVESDGLKINQNPEHANISPAAAMLLSSFLQGLGLLLKGLKFCLWLSK